jgi:hypothetical protein
MSFASIPQQRPSTATNSDSAGYRKPKEAGQSPDCTSSNFGERKPIQSAPVKEENCCKIDASMWQQLSGIPHLASWYAFEVPTSTKKPKAS